MLFWKFQMGLFDDPYVDPAEAERVVGSPAHTELALQAAREIAALPAGAVAVSRRLLRGHLDAVVRQIDTEVMHFKDRLQSDEARAAFSAFLSRKK